MSLADVADEYGLSPAVRDEVTAFYCWQTVARRRRLMRSAAYRRARCPQCGAHKTRLLSEGRQARESVCRACVPPRTHRTAHGPRQRPIWASGGLRWTWTDVRIGG